MRKKKRKITISIALSPDLVEKLDSIIELEFHSSMSRSELIEYYLREFLKIRPPKASVT